MPRATLQTVADALGVSRSTVSNAYNRPDQLTADLRERVLAEAERIGYAGPNAAARSLRRGRAGALGLLFTESLSYAFSDPYAVGFLQGLGEVVERHGTSLLLVPTNPRSGETDAIEPALAAVAPTGPASPADSAGPAGPARTTGPAGSTPDGSGQGEPRRGQSQPGLGQRQPDRGQGHGAAGTDHRVLDAVRQAVVDGFCLYCVEADDPAIEVIQSRGLPLVSTDEMEGLDIPSAGIDDYAGALAAAQHVARLGHRHVTVLMDQYPRLPLRGAVAFDEAVRAGGREARERLRGYRDGLPDADLSVVVAARNSREAGHAMVGEVLDRADRPTAVLTTSDVLALGVLDGLRQRGLVAGRDVSVVGFDDVQAAADVGLTTIHQPMVDRGRAAGELLLEPGRRDRRTVFATRLVVRSSTGPVRS